MNLKRTHSLKLHPMADEVPVMSPDELDELVLDIEARGILVPIEVNGRDEILDGRHRWQAACALGLDEVPTRRAPCAEDEEFVYMLKAAILRRQLTTEQRKALARKVLFTEPASSDRQVAKAAGLSHPTVAKIRAEAEDAGDVERVSTRTDSKGRQQPGARAEKRKRTARANAKQHVRRHRPGWVGHLKRWCKQVRPENKAVLREIDEAITEAWHDLRELFEVER